MISELICAYNTVRDGVTAKKAENRHEPIAVEKAGRLRGCQLVERRSKTEARGR